MRRLVGHTKEVRSLAYTPDGRLVSGGGDRTVRVSDPLTGECLHVIKARRVIYAVAASPAGRLIAIAGKYAVSADARNVIQLYDPDDARLIAGLVWHQGEQSRSIWNLSFSADGAYLAAACRQPGGGNIPAGAGAHWWRFPDGSPDLDRHGDIEGAAYSLRFAPTGHALAANFRTVVDLYDSPEKPPRHTAGLSAYWAPALAFVPPVEADGSGRLFDTASDGHRLAAVAGASSYLYFIDTANTDYPRDLKTGFHTINAIAVSPDQRTMLVGGMPGSLERYDLETRTRTAVYDFELGKIHDVAFAPDGATYAIGGEGGLLICDVE